jgi:hypothetical protein
VLSTGCASNANWTTTLISSGSGNGEEPSMVFADNRIAIATRDSSSKLRFYYCYDANDCTNIANWTRDVVISDDTSFSGHSLGNSSYEFYIIRKTGTILKKYNCYYTSGCESKTDWYSMNMFSVSSDYLLSDQRNMAASNDGSTNEYITTIVDGVLKVGICTGYYCYNSTNWEYVDIQNVSSAYGSDYQADIAVYNNNIFVTYISNNELKIARCDMSKTSCYNRDNWKIGSIYKSPALRSSDKNLKNLSLVYSGGNTFVYQAYGYYQMLYFFYGGLMEPEW